MFKGINYALAACCIWGLIFVIPQFMTGFSSVEVALGRYFAYGLVSIAIFLKNRKKGLCSYPRTIWMQAFGFSLISTMVFYTSIVLSVRYATPAICALIAGIAPVTIAFYGNWRKKECRFKSLLPSSILIFTGLLVINVPYLVAEGFIFDYWLGVVYGFIALASWSWYVVANAQFLKDHPQVSSKDWSTLIGVAALSWVAATIIILSFIPDSPIEWSNYTHLDAAMVRFWIGSAVLGIACSWTGAYLWNQASVYLPIALAGQLTIFETIFGLIYVYTLAKEMPTALECTGITILFAAIIHGIRANSRTFVKTS